MPIPACQVTPNPDTSTLGFSNNFAAGYQTHVRDNVAQQLLVALEEYKRSTAPIPTGSGT